MSGTNGSFIVHDRHQIDGAVLTLPLNGSINHVFAVEASACNVHNMTGDIVEIRVITNPVDVGNTMAYLAPGAALSFGDYPLGFIQELIITDTGTLSNGGGTIIVNGYFN